MYPSKTVLLVEDNPALRCVLAFYLRNQGYLVREAGNAEEAERQLLGVDVVVSDLDLPGENGLDLAARTHRPTLFISGGANGLWRVRNRFPNAPFLAKPFGLKELAQAVEALTPAPLSVAS